MLCSEWVVSHYTFIDETQFVTIAGNSDGGIRARESCPIKNESCRLISRMRRVVFCMGRVALQLYCSYCKYCVVFHVLHCAIQL